MWFVSKLLGAAVEVWDMSSKFSSHFIRCMITYHKDVFPTLTTLIWNMRPGTRAQNRPGQFNYVVPFVVPRTKHIKAQHIMHKHSMYICICPYTYMIFAISIYIKNGFVNLLVSKSGHVLHNLGFEL